MAMMARKQSDEHMADGGWVGRWVGEEERWEGATVNRKKEGDGSPTIMVVVVVIWSGLTPDLPLRAKNTGYVIILRLGEFMQARHDRERRRRGWGRERWGRQWRGPRKAGPTETGPDPEDAAGVGMPLSILFLCIHAGAPASGCVGVVSNYCLRSCPDMLCFHARMRTRGETRRVHPSPAHPIPSHNPIPSRPMEDRQLRGWNRDCNGCELSAALLPASHAIWINIQHICNINTSHHALQDRDRHVMLRLP